MTIGISLDLLDARALVGIEDDVDVPAAGALGPEGASRAAGQSGAQHAGDLRWRQAQVGRPLAIDVDHQLGLAGDAAVVDVGGAGDLAHDVGDLAGERRQHLWSSPWIRTWTLAPSPPPSELAGARP